MIDYLVMFLFITVSGNPFFTADLKTLTVQFALVMFLFFNRKRRFSNQIVLFFTVLVIIYLIQALVFSFFSFSNMMGMFLRVMTAYFTLMVLGTKFIEYYIRVMFFLALMSLPFFVVYNIDPNILVPYSTLVSGEESFIDKYSMMGVYSFWVDDEFRNAGNFWEPGAFGGYMLVAFMFNFYSNEEKKNRRSVVFLIAIISSLSTTAYVSLFIFLSIIFFTRLSSIWLRFIATVVIVFSGYFAFYSFDFLGEKIKAQIEETKNMDAYRGSANTQRFLNVLRDVKDFEGHEIVGRGTHPTTRYTFDKENQIRTVGLSDVLVRFGLPFFVLMLVMMYRSISSYLQAQRRWSVAGCVGIFITLLITLMSEAYFNYPMYWSLLFLLFVYKKPVGSYEEVRGVVR